MVRKSRFFNKILIFALVFLCGCGKETPVSVSVEKEVITEVVPEVKKEKEAITGMLQNPQIDYEVPKAYPSILVDRIGYQTKGEKQAVVLAKAIPAVFNIKDSQTGETVYSGYVKATKYKDFDRSVAIIDFTDFEVPGNYYIETEILGASFDFKISDTVISDLLAKTFHALNEKRCDKASYLPFESNQSHFANVPGGWYTNNRGERDVVEGCLGVLDLLTAYEYHQKAFDDKSNIAESRNKIPDIIDEAKFEIDWLLRMQNPETGGIYTSISYRQVAGSTDTQLMIGGESSKATAYFCTALARFSVAYNKYDGKFAEKCLKAATLAWKCMQSNKNLVTKEQLYRAAVEMYYATGAKVYNDVISDYLKDNKEPDASVRGNFDSALTYMSTKGDIDVSACRNLMNGIVDMVLDKSIKGRENPFGIESEDLSVGELLRNTNEFTIIDYINTSKQYQNTELAYLHYLSGRNRYSDIFAENLESPDDCAKLLILLGRLCD